VSLYSHPAQLEDNRDCVLCMTCLESLSPSFRRAEFLSPGIELWTTHVPRSYEVALLFFVVAGFLHRLPLQTSLGLNLDLTQFWPHLGLSLVTLIVPASIPILVYGLMQLFHLL